MTEWWASLGIPDGTTRLLIGAVVAVIVGAFVLPMYVAKRLPRDPKLSQSVIARRLRWRFGGFGVTLTLATYAAHHASIGEDAWLLAARLGMAMTIAFAAMALSSLLTLTVAFSRRWEISKMLPMKGYAQLARIGLWLVALVLMVASLGGQPIGYYLGGLSAVAAVLVFVFRDTLLSLVAVLQIHQLKILRIGDWIEAPAFHVDGEVTDISLHTVVIRNWDHTLNTIPTMRVIDTPLRNWNGMIDSGGRRIKRAIPIDMWSVSFLKPEEIESFKELPPLTRYIETRVQEIADYNDRLQAHNPDGRDLRRFTNIGMFRAYAQNYLRQHPKLNTIDFTCMVRQLPPNEAGIPLEVYAFTNTVDWAEYESIQADVFDHLLSKVEAFGLRVYQRGTTRPQQLPVLIPTLY